MNNLITVEITQRNFELVRNRIAVILANELEYQDYVSTDELFELPTIKLEGRVAFDISEMPIINVCLSNGDYGNKDVRQTEGTYVYNIDVHCKSKKVGATDGDTLSSLKVQRMLGICQAILDNPVYKTLNFGARAIHSVTVSNLNVQEIEKEKGDLESCSMGRLQVTVRCPEGNSLIDANQIDSYGTIVMMALTERGYSYGVTTGQPEPPPICSPVTVVDEYEQAIGEVASGNELRVEVINFSGDLVSPTYTLENNILLINLPNIGGSNAKMIIINNVTTTAQDNELIGAYTLANLCIFGNGTEQISINNITSYNAGTGTITFIDDLGDITIRVILIA